MTNAKHADARAEGVRADPARPARKPLRLTRRAEFLAAARLGRKAPVHGLVLQALARDDDAPARLGFTVTRKVGNAVVRNRTKRRLRACARAVLGEAPLTGVDLVLIGRDATRSRRFALLLDDLRRALAKAGVQPAALSAKAGVQPAAPSAEAGQAVRSAARGAAA